MFPQIIHRNRARRAVRLSSALAPWANWLFFPIIVATMFWIAAFFARDASLPLWVRVAAAAAFAWAGMAGIQTNLRQWKSVALFGEHLIVRQYLSTDLIPLTCIEAAGLHRTPQGLPFGVLTLRSCCRAMRREIIFPARDGTFPHPVLAERLSRLG